jgi:hypothetical protein
MTNDGTLTVAKVTPIDAARPQPTATHTITYTLDGFQITSVIETAAPIRQIVDKLKSIGAEPPLQNLQKPEPTKTAGAPLCPAHGTPMAPSTKRPGTYYCKATVGQHPDDGRTLYCTKKG